jgi:long-chain acyl-CoA synthetase
VSFLSIAHVAAAMQAEIAPLVSRLVPHFAPPKTELIDVFRGVRPNVLGMTPRFFQKIAVKLAVAQESGSALSRALHRYGMRIGRRIVHKRWEGKPVSLHERIVLKFLQRTIFRRLLATVGFDRVRRAQTGSAMMPVEVAALWAVWGVDIREAYGLSEAACAVAYQLEEFPRSGTIGKLIPGQVDTELELASDGEILFKSPMVFSGYWNAPEATAKALREGWFHTGDIAERMPDGNLRLIGRKNDAISTAGGKTINPAEIENELKLSPYISEAVVFGHGEKYLAALVELEFASVLAWAKERGQVAACYSDLADLAEVAELIEREVQAANGKLGRALQIKKFRILPMPLDQVEGALTSAKKIKRRVVQEQFHELLELMYDRSENRILAARLRG